MFRNVQHSAWTTTKRCNYNRNGQKILSHIDICMDGDAGMFGKQKLTSGHCHPTLPAMNIEQLKSEKRL